MQPNCSKQRGGGVNRILNKTAEMVLLSLPNDDYDDDDDDDGDDDDGDDDDDDDGAQVRGVGACWDRSWGWQTDQTCDNAARTKRSSSNSVSRIH